MDSKTLFNRRTLLAGLAGTVGLGAVTNAATQGPYEEAKQKAFADTVDARIKALNDQTGGGWRRSFSRRSYSNRTPTDEQLQEFAVHRSRLDENHKLHEETLRFSPRSTTVRLTSQEQPTIYQVRNDKSLRFLSGNPAFTDEHAQMVSRLNSEALSFTGAAGSWGRSRDERIDEEVTAKIGQRTSVYFSENNTITFTIGEEPGTKYEFSPRNTTWEASPVQGRMNYELITYPHGVTLFHVQREGRSIEDNGMSIAPAILSPTGESVAAYMRRLTKTVNDVPSAPVRQTPGIVEKGWNRLFGPSSPG